MAEDKAQRGKILDRVRALLSMTIENGCSEHEAMTAAAKAAKLMEEYDLTFSDVNAIKGDRVGKQSKPFSASNKSHEMHAAGIYVSVSIGNFFDCKVWRNGSDVVFFGLKDDVDLAHDMLAMIRAAMDRELSTFLVSPEAAGSGEHRRTLSHSFMRGMGHRISQRLERLKAERTANVKAKGTELVIVKGAIVTEAYAKQFGRDFVGKAKPSAAPKSTTAFSAGYQAGNRVGLGVKEVAAESVAATRSTATQATPPAQPASHPPVPPSVRQAVDAWHLLAAEGPGWRFWFATIAARMIIRTVSIFGIVSILTGLLGLQLMLEPVSGGPKAWNDLAPVWFQVWARSASAPACILVAMFEVLGGFYSNGSIASWRSEVAKLHRNMTKPNVLAVKISLSTIEFHQKHWDECFRATRQLLIAGSVLFWCGMVFAGLDLSEAIYTARLPANVASGPPQTHLIATQFMISHALRFLFWIAIGCGLALLLSRSAAPVHRTRRLLATLPEILAGLHGD